MTGVARDSTGSARYGLGVFIDETSRGLRYGHGGWMFGYLSRMDYYPDYHFAIAVQFNSDSGDRFAVVGLEDRGDDRSAKSEYGFEVLGGHRLVKRLE